MQGTPPLSAKVHQGGFLLVAHGADSLDSAHETSICRVPRVPPVQLRHTLQEQRYCRWLFRHGARSRCLPHLFSGKWLHIAGSRPRLRCPAGCRSHPVAWLPLFCCDQRDAKRQVSNGKYARVLLHIGKRRCSRQLCFWQCAYHLRSWREHPVLLSRSLACSFVALGSVPKGSLLSIPPLFRTRCARSIRSKPRGE
jgi:hypothetical protein